MKHITWPQTIKEKEVELIFINGKKVIGRDTYERRNDETKKVEEEAEAQERDWTAFKSLWHDFKASNSETWIKG